MNKNLKKIIALTFAVSVFSSIIPTTNLNLMTTKAYANEKDGITSLEVKSSSGNTLNIYNDNDYESKHEIDDSKLEPGTYYTKTSSDKVEINVSGVNSDYVRAFKGTSSDSTKGTRVGSGIDLSTDTTTIIVRVYSTNPGSVKYGDNSYISQYRLKVKYTGADADNTKNVYLDSITLSSGDITFSKKTYSYDVNVEEEINKIEIGARPDCDKDKYDNYKVKINGTKVDDDDSYKEKVSLSEGKNEIEIKVEDDDDNERTYTLNITRGEATTTTTTNSSDNNSSKDESSDNIANIKTMQWIKVNDKWQFNDSKGNTVKNSWIQNYYVQADGNMATGWLAINGAWYYFGTDGAKRIGWQLVNGAWYYFDADGKMQTGWFKDLKYGKWYYLNSNGTLA